MIRLTRAQVREVDRRAIDEFHIPGIVLMENAARSVADVAWEMLGRAGRFVTIFAGPGNNGGDGLAVARHLHNRQINVDIVPVFDPEKLAGDALINWRIVQAMGLPITPLGSVDEALASEPDLLIDALLGTGASGPPRGPIAQAIDLINRAGKAPILAIDIPSGLDCDSGEAAGACVRATRTVTFVAEKVGFATPQAPQYLGQVIVADIGCPRELMETQAS